MFTILKDMYDGNRLSNELLRNAVVKMWITPKQFEEISGEDYE